MVPDISSMESRGIGGPQHLAVTFMGPCVGGHLDELDAAILATLLAFYMLHNDLLTIDSP